MKIRFTVLMVLAFAKKAISQINLHSGGSNGIIRDHVTKPISNSIDTVHNLTMIIICLVAIVFAQRIHAKWTLGNDEVIEEITRWFFGIILCFSMIYFLKGFIDGQNFGGQTAPTITK